MQIIIGILIGAIFVYYTLTPKIKEKKEIDKDIQEANKGLRQIYCETQDNIRVVKSEYIDLQKQYKQLLKEKDELLADLHNKELEFKTLESGLQDRLSIAADNMGKKYQKDIDSIKERLDEVKTFEGKTFRYTLPEAVKTIDDLSQQIYDKDKKIQQMAQDLKYEHHLTRRLMNLLKENNIDEVGCGTIHSLQGAEKDTIIFFISHYYPFCLF